MRTSERRKEKKKKGILPLIKTIIPFSRLTVAFPNLRINVFKKNFGKLLI